MIRYIYIFFVGLFLAVFIGMGIAVFYEAPAAPKEPSWYATMDGNKVLTDAERQEEQTYIAQRDKHDQEMWDYNRNVSIMALGGAVIVLVVALMLSERVGVIADGLLLGGIFTLLYGIGRGMATDDNKYRFLIAAIGLAITLVLGYMKFVHRQVEESK